jgi:Ca2+-binding EF-hand superfamily protein
VYTLERDCEQPKSRKNNVPDLSDIANLFEFMDEDHTGMISADDFLSKLELCLKMKMANFDYKGFVKISEAKKTSEMT